MTALEIIGMILLLFLLLSLLRVGAIVDFGGELRVRVRFRNLESREISSITWGLPVSATCPVMPSPTW